MTLPSGTDQLLPGDVVALVGTDAALAAARVLLGEDPSAPVVPKAVVIEVKP